jgi:probable phosphoglycerate mutase
LNPSLPQIYLARHGETAWTLSGQHTGRTDLPLTPHGEEQARALKTLIGDFNPFAVFTSPLQRARKTCELSGFGANAHTDPDLVEWNYGDYEGLLRIEILQRRPNWQIFRDGCPDGESPEQTAARADRVITRVRAVNANALLFSSAHFLRMLAVRWIGLPPSAGAGLILDTASLSILGYEHDLTEPAIRLWNRISDRVLHA